MNIKFNKVKILSIFLLIFLASCARAPVYKTVPPSQRVDYPQLPPAARKDLVHTVGPGETVWRIAKMYNVDTKAVVRRNKINNPRKIEMGQKLVVPQAAPIRPVVTLYPTQKWKYIIIHHSATDMGNALAFNRYHNLRGFTRGLGYHFVIDNGTKGKFDGQIEVSPRWLKKQDGAHCRAGGMNCKAIGVCLVGNFNSGKITQKQMDSLVYLVNKLSNYYQIPKSNILGHGQVRGAQTDCPGKKFPWSRFWYELKKK
ncbi:MAG: N-acetylmuramoyl-L-alanine amidase [Candidatus Omnitrophica bacterium]|nr:N-acetylmuramoyl-L-alanine amidase [Candidatus Omnitrophota bacterium]